MSFTDRFNGISPGKRKKMTIFSGEVMKENGSDRPWNPVRSSRNCTFFPADHPAVLSNPGATRFFIRSSTFPALFQNLKKEAAM